MTEFFLKIYMKKQADNSTYEKILFLDRVSYFLIASVVIAKKNW